MAEETQAPTPARTTTIVLSGDTKPLSLIPSSYADIITMSTRLANSALIPAVLRGKPDDVAIIITTGLEFGFSPMMSLRNIYVVEGRPALGADAQVGICVSKRDVCEYFYAVEITSEKATYATKRKGSPEETRLTYSVADAQRAGLINKPNWKLNQIGMLANRCKSTLAKAIYPDLLLGMPSREDAMDEGEIERAVRPERDVTPKPTVPTAATKVLAAVEEAPEDAPPHDPTTGEIVATATATTEVVGTNTNTVLANAVRATSTPTVEPKAKASKEAPKQTYASLKKAVDDAAAKNVEAMDVAMALIDVAVANRDLSANDETKIREYFKGLMEERFA